MYETVTVEQAIKRGNRMMNIPVMLILFGPVLLSVYLYAEFKFPGWIIAIVGVAGFVAAWLYWAIMITRWRIWAFENVRNVQDLKKKAIAAKIISEDGSFSEKTEIRTWSDKQKLEALKSKFDQPDVFNDDYSVPAETIVHYSKGKTYTELGVAVFFLIGSACIALIAHNYIIGGGGALVFAWMGYSALKKISNTAPQIILNSKGLQTEKAPFCSWEEIQNEEIIAETQGKATVLYLVYYYGKGQMEKVQITDFDISRAQLDNLLHVYRVRSEKGSRKAYQV